MYSSSGDREIGAILREARRDAGVTLEDVEYETKIRKRYLDALEREDYADLPSAVYARGFLKTYANYLGLDGEELSRELKDRWDTVQERQRQPEAKRERSDRGAWVSRSARYGGAMANRRRRISPLAMLGFVLALALLAFAFGGLYWVGQNSRLVQGNSANGQSEQPSNGGQPSNSGVTTGNEPSTGGLQDTTASQPADQIGQTDPAGGAPQPPPPEMVKITVTVAQVPAWLNVQTDGNVAYEQVAEPGFSQTFEAGQQVQVWTGNAGAVRLEVNGQDYGSLGAPGEVKRRIFSLKPAEG